MWRWHFFKSSVKILLISSVIVFFTACQTVKKVHEGQHLLTKNIIEVNDTLIKDDRIHSLLVQKPNNKLLGIPLGLHIYNLARPQADSSYQAWLEKKPNRKKRLTRLLSKKQLQKFGDNIVQFNRWLEKSGEAPVVIDTFKTSKSASRLQRYFASYGWFNNTVDYSIIPDTSKQKRAKVVYKVQKGRPYFIDSIRTKIASPQIDSVYQRTKAEAFVVAGKQYAARDFNNERDRLTVLLRNSGFYFFDQDYVRFDADTVNTGHKAHITYLIPDRRITTGDTVNTVPFKVHKVNHVRVVTDYSFTNLGKQFTDSTRHKGYTLYGYENIRYRAKAITDAISITPGAVFKDIDRTLTYNQISELRIFKYPNISYTKDPNDSTDTGLIATILLSPRKKFTFETNFDVIPLSSTIQQFGISFAGSFLSRNIFRNAEILEISARGSIGSSKDAADDNSNFFNISDVGGSVKLSFPRVLSPFRTDGIIPKYMSPFTSISLGINFQKNIGLDRQSINSAFTYRWKPSSIKRYQLELFNVQYVRNLDPSNYFNVYRSSYDRLNEIALSSGYTFQDSTLNTLGIPLETETFIELVTQQDPSLSLSVQDIEEVSRIRERQNRLTENNLIFSTNFSYVRDTRQALSDNSFSRLRAKLETAGNVLSALSNTLQLDTNPDGKKKLLGVPFSQYIKTELEYIKHWELSSGSIFAMRSFAGIAIPFGNSNSIPFIRSYFAGGANDNRGWQPFDLGPGSSGGTSDFNEANFKLALNAELRFNVFNDFKAALFIDAGNIWNVLDEVDNPDFTFTRLTDFNEIAIASGLGLRYDFGFTVFRLDLGFKTYNPALIKSKRWFSQYNLANAVFNVGINYPF